MNDPALRARVESGAEHDDPSDERVRELLTALAGFAEEFLVITRTADPEGQTYLQVAHSEAPPWNFVVEYRDGGPDRHFQAFTDQVDVLHRTVTGWMSQRPGWRDLLEWQPLELRP
ncbi:hypothetical protein AAHZ94_16530 [Streptomyces sp. HSW2009]|uniref:hypothetical protein n=1 Tax=Streptomyces sp. HSW2009 TaxID=3142890 RepID=UPI0032EB35A7